MRAPLRTRRTTTTEDGNWTLIPENQSGFQLLLGRQVTIITTRVDVAGIKED
jgi:hypothetical protein